MPFRIQLTPSIAYAERSRHRLDVCRPREAVGAPVIIFFYGGAWQLPPTEHKEPVFGHRFIPDAAPVK